MPKYQNKNGNFFQIHYYLKGDNMFKKCCFNRCYRRCCYNKRYCCNRDMENREKSEYDISIEELNSLMTQNATLVDIRSPQEYREGHLNNAINLPEYEIYRNASRFLPNKNSLIIVYCDTGSRSYNAFKRLRKMGYTNVYNLYKGMRKLICYFSVLVAKFLYSEQILQSLQINSLFSKIRLKVLTNSSIVLSIR